MGLKERSGVRLKHQGIRTQNGRRGRGTSPLETTANSNEHIAPVGHLETSLIPAVEKLMRRQSGGKVKFSREVDTPVRRIGNGE